MEAIYYKRNVRSDFHVHAGYYAECIYVPSESVVLGKEQAGTFGGTDYYINDMEDILNEAKIIYNGEMPQTTNTTFSDIKKFEYDDSKLKVLINKSKLKKKLGIEIQVETENLFGAI